MGRTKGASKSDPPETPNDSLLDEIWSKLEIKLNEWITDTLPTVVRDLLKAHAVKAVDDYVSSTKFASSLSESLKFDIDELKATSAATEKKIASLETDNLRLVNKIDDLEQYTRRTNVRIFGIPESDNNEDTDDLAIKFLSSELGVQLSPNDISRSHRVGKRSTTKPRPIIVRLVCHNTKVSILRKRRLLKDNKRPFNVQEDLTVARRDILKYLHGIDNGIVSRVWTIDGTILFRPTRHSSIIERCTSIEQCQDLDITKYSR